MEAKEKKENRVISNEVINALFVENSSVETAREDLLKDDKQLFELCESLGRKETKSQISIGRLRLSPKEYRQIRNIAFEELSPIGFSNFLGAMFKIDSDVFKGREVLTLRAEFQNAPVGSMTAEEIAEGLKLGTSDKVADLKAFCAQFVSADKKHSGEHYHKNLLVSKETGKCLKMMRKVNFCSCPVTQEQFRYLRTNFAGIGRMDSIGIANLLGALSLYEPLFKDCRKYTEQPEFKKSKIGRRALKL